MGLAGGLATNGELQGGGGGGTVTSVTNSDGFVGVSGTTTVVLSEGSALTSALAAKAPLASPTFTGTVTVPTTVNATDAAQKSYVDGVAAGLAIKASVQEATAAALPTNTYLLGVITITATGTLTVDGIAVALNDRVLVKNEVAAANNGIYVCTTFGTTGVAAVLTRSSDMNQGSEVPGAFAFVEQGAVNAGTGWVVAGAGPYTIGTTAIVWTQFSGAAEESSWSPADQNAVAWSDSPSLPVVGGNSALTAGQLNLVKVKVLAPGTVTNVCVSVGVLAVGNSNSYVALFSAAGALLRQSADISTSLQSGVGFKALPLTSPVAVTPGYYYAGFWIGTNGGTPAQIGRASGNASLNFGLSAGSYRFATADGSLTTTAPNPFGTQTSGTLAFWVALT